ncbi:DoxX family protein [Paraburkholderia phenoliruptrix]|uniref:DoxX family protein n=1 Tax=Paraburkholderia phenoliruptrix TaxID=252970 RepID=UPI00286986B0|nr:DoxX family protein [Paraburkholderia phenoliruptrix]WMY10175.1 DoxX family protein [Paraburkholderia phenoliruptrix]
MTTLAAQPARLRIACTLMAALFLISGIRKLLTWSATVGYFAKLGLPMAEAIVPAAILLEIGGSLALIFGWRMREIAAILAIYTLMTAFVAHRFWDAGPAQFNPQLNNFFKNIAMVGGFLLLIEPRSRKQARE